MKICKDCNEKMIEKADIHTDIAGGVDFSERLYITYVIEKE